MSRKITVIGAGSVGATIVYTLANDALCSEILLVDIKKDKAAGEALDISQGSSYCGNVYIHDGEYEEAVDSDIVIITSGMPRKPGQSRLDLANANVGIIKQIAPEITKYAPNAMYIIVSNPVDVLTYVFNKITNIPESHIMGTGTLLDTARLRSTIADKFGINHKNVHASVLGEHGDSSFVPWSLATVAGIPVDDFAKSVESDELKINALDHAETLDFTRKSGGIIIKKKGATFYAIALSTVHLCRKLFDDIPTVATLSTMLHGEYGQSDVCVSLQTLISSKGVIGKLVPKMTPEEEEALAKSCDSMRNVIKSIDL